MGEDEVIEGEYEAKGGAMVAANVESQAQAVTAIEAVNRAEVMTAVDVAKRYPRSLAHFRKNLESMACMSKAIASKCFYTLPPRRGGDGGQSKPIVGPSIRLAEMMATCWGNISFGAQIVTIGEREAIVEAVAFDLERNIRAKEQIPVPIVGKYGRYKDDMIATACKSAMKKALRNAILTVIPRSFYEEIKDKIMKTAVGEVKDLKAAVAEAVKYCTENFQVTEEQVLRVFKRTDREDVTTEDLKHLRGYVTAIREEDLTVEDVFGKAETRSEALKARLAKDREPDPQPADVTPDTEREAQPEKPPKKK